LHGLRATRQPRKLWYEIAPDEYGFYSNVNPQVDIPAGRRPMSAASM
jgi:hypothetical protein